MGLLLLYFPKVSLLNVRFFWVCPRSSSRDAEGMKRGENCVGIFVLSLIDRVHVNFGDGPFFPQMPLLVARRPPLVRVLQR